MLERRPASCDHNRPNYQGCTLKQYPPLSGPRLTTSQFLHFLLSLAAITLGVSYIQFFHLAPCPNLYTSINLNFLKGSVRLWARVFCISRVSRFWLCPPIDNMHTPSSFQASQHRSIAGLNVKAFQIVALTLPSVSSTSPASSPGPNASPQI